MTGITGYRLTAEINRQLKLSKDIARAQSDISSGTRLQTASDDPAAWARVAVIQRQESNQQAWLSNVNTSAAVADQVSSALEGLSNSFQRAGELMVEANNATTKASDRQAIADELNGIADDIDSAATAVDSRGLPLFPANTPLPIPISRVLQITATDSKPNVFDNVQTPNGTISLSQILRTAATAIMGTDDAQRKIDSAAANDNVQAAITHITAMIGQQGVRAGRIDSIKTQLQNNASSLEEERGNLQGTDVTSTVAKMQADLLSLQAAQALFARINQSTLFDLLK
jgi:flagellar hook-associated protein 3 FlgL